MRGLDAVDSLYVFREIGFKSGERYNSEKIIEIYKGKLNEFSQSVALNVAAGLIVADKENNFKKAHPYTRSIHQSCLF